MPFHFSERLSESERAVLMGGACAKAYGWSPAAEWHAAHPGAAIGMAEVETLVRADETVMAPH